MYSHPYAINPRRRLFSRRLALVARFWTAYAVFIALITALVIGAFSLKESAMQPWDAVQVSNEENPHHGRAGVVTQINRESGQTVVRLDADSERTVVEVAVDVSELKRL